MTNFFQYTGRDFDTETGLYYYRARYYDSSSGRFLSEDPIHFGAGPNSFRFVNNNPVLLIDPMGLCPAQPKPQRNEHSPSPCLWVDAGAFIIDVATLFQPELAPWAVSASGHALACNLLWELNP